MSANRNRYFLLTLLLSGLCAAALPGSASAQERNKPKPKPKPAEAKVPAQPARPKLPPPPGPPFLTAAAAMAIDAKTGRILYEKAADSSREIASTQKLLTALVIIGEGNLDQELVIEKSDTEVVPSKLYLKEGDSHPRRLLLQSLMVKSANDVARCLARDNAGGLEEFAAKMNALAKEIGMQSSNFENPSGLSAKGQYSCARDLGKLSMKAYTNEELLPMLSIVKMRFTHTDGRIFALSNTNRLLRDFPYCNGMKTGFTNKAGRCLVSSAVKDDKEVIAIVLGNTNAGIWKDSLALLKFGLGIDGEVTVEPKDAAPAQ